MDMEDLPALFIHHVACKIIWIGKYNISSGIFLKCELLEKGDGPVQRVGIAKNSGKGMFHVTKYT